jgi:glycogen phosphorylase
LILANIEIGEETGEDNIFLFGTLTPAVEDIRHRQVYGSGVNVDPKLEQVLDSIREGKYGSAAIFESLLNTLATDHYLIHTDFSEYLEIMLKVDAVFKDQVNAILLHT